MIGNRYTESYVVAFRIMKCMDSKSIEMYGLNIDKDNLMWGFLIVKKSKTNLD
jgi:hypothetical protein